MSSSHDLHHLRLRMRALERLLQHEAAADRPTLVDVAGPARQVLRWADQLGAHPTVTLTAEAAPPVHARVADVERLLLNLVLHTARQAHAADAITIAVSPDGGGVAIDVTHDDCRFATSAERAAALVPLDYSLALTLDFTSIIAIELTRRAGGVLHVALAPTCGACTHLWLPAAPDFSRREGGRLHSMD